MEEMKAIDLKSLVYFDESGMNSNERYDYAWGKKGVRIYDEKPGGSTHRMSILAGLRQKKLCAPLAFNGYCTRPVVERYFEKVLLPEIGPDKTIVLDNASFHKGGQIEEIVKKHGCFLKYLPAYSPDLNPIEHQWAPLKKDIKKELHNSRENNLLTATCNVFEKMGNSI